MVIKHILFNISIYQYNSHLLLKNSWSKLKRISGVINSYLDGFWNCGEAVLPGNGDTRFNSGFGKRLTQADKGLKIIG